MVEILNILQITFLSLLILWYSLKFIGIPKLVNRTQLTEVYKLVIVDFLFTISLIGAILNLTFGEWIMLITLIFWGYIQYKNHWYWILNEPNEEEIRNYKEKFGENISLFKQEEKKIKLDLFHTLLHLLAISNFIIIAIRLVQFMTYLPD